MIRFNSIHSLARSVPFISNQSQKQNPKSTAIVFTIKLQKNNRQHQLINHTNFNNQDQYQLKMPPYTPLPARLSESDGSQSPPNNQHPLSKPKSRRINVALSANNAKKERKRQTKRNSSSCINITNGTNHTLATCTRNFNMCSDRDRDRNSKSVHRIMHCPAADVTYEGHILSNNSSRKELERGDTTCNHNANNNSNSNGDAHEGPVHYIKHGKGILHDHSNHMTIQGYFQNNLIIGYALQTLYLHPSLSSKTSLSNDAGPHILMAQYEGTFQLQESSTASTSTSTSEPESQQWQRHGMGKYTFHNTNDTYSGQFRHNVFHGHGAFVWGATGDRYEGPFKKGFMHGHGVKYTQGDVFKGKFKRGKAHGWGNMMFGNGDVFDGMYCRDLVRCLCYCFVLLGWMTLFYCHAPYRTLHDVVNVIASSISHQLIFTFLNSQSTIQSYVYSFLLLQRQGFGTYSWNNGDEYVGNWDSGRTSGRGIKSFIYSMGRSRSGSFLPHHLQHNHHYHHQDIIDIDNGANTNALPLSHGDMEQVHHGEWDRDTATAEGTGIRTYACGDQYCGLFSHDSRNGYGVYTWANGDVYEGEFSHGFPCGLGVKRMRNGDVLDGEWDQGKVCGYGVKSFAMGGAHMGFYREDERCGDGIMVWPNGDEYRGNFEDGDQCGFGMYYYANANAHGNGNESTRSQSDRDSDSDNASVYRGQWCKKKKHGPGYFKVNVRNRCRIYFELWFRGKRVSKQKVSVGWNHVPSIEQLQRKWNCLQELKKEHWIAHI